MFRDFPTFSRSWIFFLLRLYLFDLLSFSLLFSDSSHLCFSCVHIVGSLTSKLPSIMITILLSAPPFQPPHFRRSAGLYDEALWPGWHRSLGSAQGDFLSERLVPQDPLVAFLISHLQQLGCGRVGTLARCSMPWQTEISQHVIELNSYHFQPWRVVEPFDSSVFNIDRIPPYVSSIYGIENKKQVSYKSHKFKNRYIDK